MTNTILTAEGYRVKTADTAEEALVFIQRDTPPDVLVCDVQLPGLSGLRLCEILRAEPATARLPILMLTVMGSGPDKIKGLKTGADDYLAKPYNPGELTARVEALLRRANGNPPSKTHHGAKDLIVDTARREVFIKGKPVHLRHMEYELLLIFLGKKGLILRRDALLSLLWKDDTVVTENTLTVHIRNLRKKLGPCGQYIETLVNEGYRFKDL